MNLLVLLLSVFFSSGPELSFLNNRIVNAGQYREGELIEINSRIKNTGDEGLLIISTVATCNCTSVNYPKKTIAPGEEEEIKIRIDTNGKSGPGTVVVKLLTNTIDKYSLIRVDYVITK
ncbi:MAG: DUF1573 domain-containing protein [Bacteroidales bacterium]|nr:DUF1573 domain-containing protein [Bacteroidales bacterium]